jgi:beta-glucuronidase
MQAGLTLVGSHGPQDRSGRHYTKPRAAVTVRGGHRVTVADCRFTQLGGAGAVLESGTRHSTVTRCRFTDLASGALYLGDLDPHPPTPEAADQGNHVTYNEISHCGTEFTDAVGIWAGYTRDLTISHNTVEHLPYSGISLGWGWNQPEAHDPWLGDNTIHANRIVDVLQPHIGQHDGGAIYTQGQQPGTVVTGNYINRSEYPARLTDGNGVYLDEQSSHIAVTGNVVTRVGYKWVSNWAEYGVDNHASGNWTDNTVTPPLSGGGSTMTDNQVALTALPPEAVTVAGQAGAGPWPAPVAEL